MHDPFQRYDLKGSKVGRAVSEEEKKNPTVILKDLDFKTKRGKLKIGYGRKEELLNQVIVCVCIYIYMVKKYT